MADQMGTDVKSGAQPDGSELSGDAPSAAIAEGGGPGQYEPYHGRPVSWVAVGTIVAGFLAGGLALVFGTIWWLFWVGVGLVVIGGLLALSTDIFEDWY
jgi:hypothetical protein